MAGILRAVRVLGDEGRLRILHLLQQEELSVAELQEILGMGQSRISMQLAQLKQAGLVEVRRAGQKSLYRLRRPLDGEPVIAEMLRHAPAEIPEVCRDNDGLGLVLRKRKDKLRGYFDDLAGKFGRHYIPGRSWQGMAEMLLRLLIPNTSGAV